MEIGDRIEMVLHHYNLNQAQLAEKIGVSEASISKAIKGRSNPGTKIILGLLEAFPFLSAEWLIRGAGEMRVEKSEVSFFQESQAAYLTKKDLITFSRLVQKVDELEVIVKELQKSIDNVLKKN